MSCGPDFDSLITSGLATGSLSFWHGTPEKHRTRITDACHCEYEEKRRRWRNATDMPGKWTRFARSEKLPQGSRRWWMRRRRVTHLCSGAQKSFLAHLSVESSIRNPFSMDLYRLLCVVDCIKMCGRNSTDVAYRLLRLHWKVAKCLYFCYYLSN